jgi:acetyl esterase/lipase
MRRTVKAQLDNIGDDVQAFRQRMDSANGLMPKLPKDALVEKVDVDGIPCEWVSSSAADSHRILMYLHGGGYVFGGFDSHRDLAFRLSKASGMRVLLVGYRLAPENPFPAAVEDAAGCYRWLLTQGYEPGKIAIGGDSAGGGLTLSTLVNLKNLGVAQPAGAILLSPWLDLTVSGSSVATNARVDAMLSPVSLDSFARLYLGELDRKAPLASPLFADLSGLPAMLVHVGSTEVLLSDAQRLVENIEKAGGEIALDIWPKMPHVFQLFSGRIPEGKAAIEQLGQFIQNRTAAG